MESAIPDRERFLVDGFLVCPAFIEESEVTQMELEVAALFEATSSSNLQIRVVRDERGNVTAMNQIDRGSDYLYDMARRPNWLEFAEALLGKPAQPLQVEYFAKPAGSSRPTPPHQDQCFFVEHFGSEMAVTFWVALDDVVESNGALRYGTPTRLELFAHEPSASPDFGLELAPHAAPCIAEWKTAEVRRGGCVVHHSFAVHAADRNSTSRSRRAIAFNYRGSPWRAYIKEKGA